MKLGNTTVDVGINDSFSFVHDLRDKSCSLVDHTTFDPAEMGQ